MIAPGVYIAEDAVVIGDVEIGESSSVWFKSVIRGDVNHIRIGNRTNIQDGSILHVTSGNVPLIIGDDVTAGHRVILHSCEIKDRVLIGMGSILLDGSMVESDSIIAAGTILSPNTVIPSGKLVMGIPGRVKRDLTQQEIDNIRVSAELYVENARIYSTQDESSRN